MKLDDARHFELQGRYLEAEKIFRTLIKNEPNNGQAYWGLGRLALKAGFAENAVTYLNKACHLLPNEPFPLIHLAKAFNEILAEQDALTVLNYASKTFPNVTQLFYELGLQQITVGRLTEAQDNFQKVLQLSNNNDADILTAYAFLEICQLKKMTTNDPYFNLLKLRLADSTLTPQEEIVIRYAFAKVLNDNKDYDGAWLHYQKANDLQLSECNFETAELNPFFQNIKLKCNKDSLANPRAALNNELTPIFILGLPRTGSSLLEYILAKHPDISGAGELPYIGRQVADYCYSQTSQHYPKFVPNLTEVHLEEAAQIYLKLIARHAKGKKYVIDKLPANFQSIGLIYKLFPKAKVIHITRDLPATAFSIFSNYFAENEPYFCSLEQFKQYSDLHDELMSHWHTVLPGIVHEAQYEQLIENPRVFIQEILKFCGLKWHDTILAEPSTEVAVKTLSKVQVRKPITKHASTAWKNYQQHLSGFIDQ